MNKQKWILKTDHQVICSLMENESKEDEKWIYNHHPSDANPRKARVAFSILYHSPLTSLKILVGAHLTMSSSVLKFFSACNELSIFLWRETNQVVLIGLYKFGWNKLWNIQRDDLNSKTFVHMNQVPVGPSKKILYLR